MTRRYRPWTTNEERLLSILWSRQHVTVYIAALLHRTYAGVQAKRLELGLAKRKAGRRANA